MHKDSTYTLRLDSKMKAGLKVSARRDQRTVASLVKKLIADHLTKEGFELPEEGEDQGSRENQA